jgi:hypothetical protein
VGFPACAKLKLNGGSKEIVSVVIAGVAAGARTLRGSVAVVAAGVAALAVSVTETAGLKGTETFGVVEGPAITLAALQV